MKRTYSIHNLLDFTIEQQSSYSALGLAKYVPKQYENFAASPIVAPGLEIVLNDSLPDDEPPDQRTGFSVDSHTLVWEDGFRTTGRYKQAKWQISVRGLFTELITARVACNPPGYLIITGQVIDQLLALALVTRKSAFIHAACIENASGGHLLGGSSGTGKTTLTTFLVEQGYKYLGDNFCILGNGEVKSYLSPLNLFGYNVTDSLRDKLARSYLTQLRWRGLVYRLTRDYVKLFLKVNPETLWPDSMVDRSSIQTILFAVAGRQFEAIPMERQDAIDSLLHNMKLELKNLDVWMTRYSYVFPDRYPQGWWAEYRSILQRAIPPDVRCLRITIPQRCDASVTQSIQEILERTRDAG